MNKYLIIRAGVFACLISTFLFVLPQSVTGQDINNEMFYIPGFFKPRIYFNAKKVTIAQKDTYTSKINEKIFNPASMPFFCRIEHKIEKSGNIPFRFRLGDLNYVNMLENKK